MLGEAATFTEWLVAAWTGNNTALGHESMAMRWLTMKTGVSIVLLDVPQPPIYPPIP